MHRSMMQVYVQSATEAIALYQRAFDATLLSLAQGDDGTVFHSELDVHGQIVALSDAPGERIPGNTMQFVLHFEADQQDTVRRAYDALCEGGLIEVPLGPCFYSPCMGSVTDRFGVRWCVFTS